MFQLSFLGQSPESFLIIFATQHLFEDGKLQLSSIFLRQRGHLFDQPKPVGFSNCNRGAQKNNLPRLSWRDHRRQSFLPAPASYQTPSYLGHIHRMWEISGDYSFPCLASKIRLFIWPICLVTGISLGQTSVHFHRV